MPTVERFNRCRIEMYFDDHLPPHFHVITRKNERIAVVIETLIIQAGSADSRDTAEAFAWRARTARNCAHAGGSIRRRSHE